MICVSGGHYSYIHLGSVRQPETLTGITLTMLHASKAHFLINYNILTLKIDRVCESWECFWIWIIPEASLPAFCEQIRISGVAMLNLWAQDNLYWAWYPEVQLVMWDPLTWVFLVSVVRLTKLTVCHHFCFGHKVGYKLAGVAYSQFNR